MLGLLREARLGRLDTGQKHVLGFEMVDEMGHELWLPFGTGSGSGCGNGSGSGSGSGKGLVKMKDAMLVSLYATVAARPGPATTRGRNRRPK